MYQYLSLHVLLSPVWVQIQNKGIKTLARFSD